LNDSLSVYGMDQLFQTPFSEASRRVSLLSECGSVLEGGEEEEEVGGGKERAEKFLMRLKLVMLCEEMGWCRRNHQASLIPTLFQMEKERMDGVVDGKERELVGINKAIEGIQQRMGEVTQKIEQERRGEEKRGEMEEQIIKKRELESKIKIQNVKKEVEDRVKETKMRFVRMEKVQPIDSPSFIAQDPIDHHEIQEEEEEFVASPSPIKVEKKQKRKRVVKKKKEPKKKPNKPKKNTKKAVKKKRRNTRKKKEEDKKINQEEEENQLEPQDQQEEEEEEEVGQENEREEKMDKIKEWLKRGKQECEEEEEEEDLAMGRMKKRSRGGYLNRSTTSSLISSSSLLSQNIRIPKLRKK